MSMNGKRNYSWLLPLMVLPVLVGLVQSDGQALLRGRMAHEIYLNALIFHLSEGPKGPQYAGFRDYLMCMNPATRRVPPKAWLNAARKAEKARTRNRLKSGIFFEWEEIPSNTGGRTRAILYDPNDPGHRKVWAGGVTGGLWYCEDIQGEGTWKPVNDLWPSLAISCICYDPVDPETYYVGTGEGQTAVVIYRESSGRGSGIWKSTDAGKSWEQLASSEDFEYITDIAVRNESGKAVIYAAVVSGVYKEMAHSSKPTDGLYRSTDGGESWAQVLPEIPGTGIPFSPADIEIGPAGRIFVGTMRNLFQEGGGRILYSDNGVNWTVMDAYVSLIENRKSWNIPGRVIVACAPSDEDRVYAILSGGQVSADDFIRSEGVIIIKSFDGGKTWTQATLPKPSPFSNAQWAFLAWHALTVVVQPDDPDVIWIGGLDLYRSNDGGWTWSQKTLWWNWGPDSNEEYPVYVHADQHNLVYRPGSRDELLNSNDGGVFITGNARDEWPRFQEVNRGYNTLQYYTCAIHPEAGKRYFLGGCQDNGTFRTTETPTSKEVSVSYGDGAYCFIDENEPEIQISSSQFNYYYYSVDGNHQNIHVYDFPGGTFINPVDYDPVNNVLYANGMDFEGNYRDSIFRIRLVNDTLLEATAVAAHTNSLVPFTAMHVLPSGEGGNTVVLAGSQSGRLFRLDSAQSVIKPKEIGSPEFPPGYISCVTTDGTINRILLTFSSYGVKHVWETTDGGITWLDKTGNLPDMPVRWAIYTPGSEGSVMLATELGIWFTEDIDADSVAWIQSSGSLPNVRVDMLRTRKADHHILAGTHGRGLFLSAGPLEVKLPEVRELEPAISLFPNPAGQLLRVKLPGAGDWTLDVLNASGILIRRTMIRASAEGGTGTVDLEGLPAGTYLLIARTGEQHISKRFIKRE